MAPRYAYRPSRLSSSKADGGAGVCIHHEPRRRILGADEQLLWDLADEMDPEDGCLWIHRTDDQTIAFTPPGMEYLRELLAEHKLNRSPLRC